METITINKRIKSKEVNILGTDGINLKLAKRILDKVELYVEANDTTCARRRVGCYILDKSMGVILGRGVNSKNNMKGSCTLENCLRKDCASGEGLDKCDVVHAEINAIADLRKGIKAIIPFAKVAMVTTKPCGVCSRALIELGIKYIVYREPYNDNRLEEMCAVEFKIKGVEVIQL